MSDLFREFDASVRRAYQYAEKWGVSNPGERAKYEAFADAILRGENPEPPVLQVPPKVPTWFGQALILAGRMALTEGVPEPEPDPAPDPTGVLPPVAPSPYSLPSGIVVSSVSQLEAAVAAGNQDIVLDDGSYGDRGALNLNGCRLYARNLGGATIRFGLYANGAGSLLRGIVLDVEDPARALHSSIVRNGGANLRVLDCWLRGNKRLAYGVAGYNPEGLEVRRVVASDLTDVALRASNNVAVAYGSATPKIAGISDIDVDGVARSVPGASNGTAECAVWVGHPVLTPVERIRSRNVSWTGVEPVNNCWDTTFRDLDIDMNGPLVSAGVCVYMEHKTINCLLEMAVLRGKHGINAEWFAAHTTAAARDNTIRDMLIETARVGCYFDEGTGKHRIERVHFKGQSWAAVGAYKPSAGNPEIVDCTYDLPTGAKQFTNSHINSPA